MIFTPMIKGAIKNNEAFKNLTDSSYLQAKLKAEEVTLPLHVVNILTPREYMQDQTIENVIHSMVLNTPQIKGFPIFKHITRKWMKDPTIVRYEVTVQTKLERKASKVLNNPEKL